MMHKKGFTRKQRIVMRAIFEVRTLEGTLAVSPTEVEKATEKFNNDKKISRNNWNPSGAVNATWLAIGEAIHGRLPPNDPVEKAIRSFKGREAPAEFMKELEDKLDEVTGQLAEAVKAKDKAEGDLKNFKERCYSEQSEDALYKITFEKTIAQNKILTKPAATDKDTITALNARVSELEGQLEAFAQVDDEVKSSANVSRLRPPKLFEPTLHGTNPSEKVQTLLDRYTKEIDIELDHLKKAALKETMVDIAIVFHRFNISDKAFYKSKIPFRSSVNCHLVFSCFAPTSITRRKVYEKVALLATFSPHVILVGGEGKVVSMPAEKRTSESDHEWFVSQARKDSGGFRVQKVDVLSEGYENVVVRRVDDE